MPISPLPTPPTRQDPSSFAERGDAFLAALPTFQAEANATAAEVNANTAICQSAAQTINVTAWVSGKTYATGEHVYDTTNFLTYRRKTNGAGTTRPGLDGTNWQLLTGFGDVDSTSNQTIGGIKTFSQPIVGSLNGNASTATTATNATSASYATNARGVFFKADPNTVAFTKTGNGTASVKDGTVVDVKGTPVAFASATAITMPTLSSGTDYAIYACADGSIRADASFTAPSGYTTANSRQIGGFHYAPGGNATAQAGGNTTAQINEFSFWDLKFRPACPDPRGMTLVADGFWADIYLLGVDHLVNGTSKFNVTIADGSSPPRVPTKFGGNGTTTYTTLNWWEAREVMVHHGKRLPTYGEFAALAYGTTEATQGGTDPVSTILRNAFTSRWGVMLAAGNMWVWGDEFGGGAASAGWTANTGGRGSTYQMENAVLFGGSWDYGANCGSRCSSWSNSPTGSGNSFGARGVCDHLILD